MLKPMKQAAVRLVAAMVVAGGSAAEAAVVATMQEVGGNSIVVTGGGTVNVRGLTRLDGTYGLPSRLLPANNNLTLGPTFSNDAYL